MKKIARIYSPACLADPETAGRDYADCALHRLSLRTLKTL